MAAVSLVIFYYQYINTKLFDITSRNIILIVRPAALTILGNWCEKKKPSVTRDYLIQNT